MIKNIVFDVGDVIINWHPRDIISQFTNDEEAIDILSKEVFFNTDWYRMDSGELSYWDGVELFKSRVPDNLKEYVDLILNPDNWTNLNIYAKETEDLIDKLKENGYKCYILSNMSDVMSKTITDSSPGKKMDGLIFSAFEHTVKPNKEIYEILFNRYNLKPEECFFIDDRKANIDAGISLGMKGHVFDINNYDSLYKALKEEGITI